MANLGHSTAFAEGHATNRPPLFDGSNYTYWKARMRIFLLSTDYDVWSIVESGYHKPTQMLGDTVVEKPKDKWDEADKKRFSLNAKAMNALYCALNPDEFNRVSACETAQEIWEKLETTHEGTSQVKEAKLAMLISKYEAFKMHPSESIQEMITRFTDIVNKSKALGKDYKKEELVRKVLRSLPSEYDPKVTAIEESHKLSDMSFDILVGNLITHETRLKEREGRQEEDTKKKSMALKAKQRKSKKDTSSSSEEEDNKDEMGLVVRGLKKFLRTKKGQQFFQNKRSHYHNKGKKAASSDSESEQLCHNCRKKGHFRRDCPYLKKKAQKGKDKEKGLKVITWDQSTDEEHSSEASSSDDEPAAHLALMARGDTSGNSHAEESGDEVHSNPDEDELIEKYSEMLYEYEKLAKKHRKLKKSYSKLETENESLNNQLSQELEKNKCLNEKINETPEIKVN